MFTFKYFIVFLIKYLAKYSFSVTRETILAQCPNFLLQILFVASQNWILNTEKKIKLSGSLLYLKLFF